LIDPWVDDASAAIAQRIDALDGVDWQRVLVHARRHRVAPLAARRLEASELASSLSADVLSEFRREGKAALFHEMAMFGELRGIKAALDAESVRFLLIKGLALSSEGHGRMGMRINHDIDLVISPDDLERSHCALCALGYDRVEPSADFPEADLPKWIRRCKDWVYVNASSGMVVELHHRLFDNPALCDAGVMARARAVSLFGQVEVLTLGEADEPGYLALHGALHAWSRLKWLLDLAIVLRELGPDGVEALLVRHRKQPAERALHQALRLCSELFEIDCTGKRMSHPLGTGLLVAAARHALNGNDADELEATRFGTSIKNASHYLLWHKPGYLIAELMFDLTDTSRDPDVFGRNVPVWLRRPMAWIARHRRTGVDG
jgi:hypothetical protein